MRIYTLAAASRITGIPTTKIARLEVWPKVVLVVFHKGHGLRPRFVSKNKFKEDFVEFRKQGSLSCVVTHAAVDGCNGIYAVRGSGDPRLVTVHNGRIYCDCPDYSQISQSLPQGRQGACKHIYAVLRFHAISSLAEFVREQQQTVPLF